VKRGSGWISDAKARCTVSMAIGELNLEMSGRGFSPCPACGERKRGSNDGRPACGQRDGGWQCFSCKTEGDVLHLVSQAALGKSAKGLAKTEWSHLRKWFASRGYCEEHGPRAQRANIAPLKERRKPAERMTGGVSFGRSNGRQMKAKATPTAFDFDPGLAQRAKDLLWSDEGRHVLGWLMDERGFDEHTLRHFGVGCAQLAERVREGRDWVDQRDWWVVIPLRNPSGQVVNYQFRRVPRVNGEEAPKPKYRLCPEVDPPLFNVDSLGADMSSVILCEGVFEVLTMWQWGWETSVVSTTAGAGTFHAEWIEPLDLYENFIIVYDQDEAGDEGVELVADRLGPAKCSRVRLPHNHNDLNDCLTEGVPVEDIEAAVQGAEPLIGIVMKRAGDYESDILEFMTNPEQLYGSATGSDKLDEHLKGIRPGLWLITGPEGHGKTTFAHWLLYNQASIGHPVGITSFEQQPIGSVQKLLRIGMGGDFMKNEPEDVKAAFGRLDQMPIWILDHYGKMDAEVLLETISFARRRYGIHRFLIDHLHFLARETEEIEELVRALATLAVNEGIAIFLIAHPNRQWKSLRKKRPDASDIKGSSSASQDAHVALVVWKAPPTEKRPYTASWIAIDKDRAEFGSAGSEFLMAYDPEACVYADSWWDTPMGIAEMSGAGLPPE